MTDYCEWVRKGSICFEVTVKCVDVFQVCNVNFMFSLFFIFLPVSQFVVSFVCQWSQKQPVLTFFYANVLYLYPLKTFSGSIEIGRWCEKGESLEAHFESVSFKWKIDLKTNFENAVNRKNKKRKEKQEIFFALAYLITDILWWSKIEWL